MNDDRLNSSSGTETIYRTTEQDSTTNDETNSTSPDAPNSNFFDTYNSTHRVALETTLAVIAITCNLTVLLAVQQATSFLRRQRNSTYNLLFINLSVVNIISCVLAWTSNNVFFFFAEFWFAIKQRNECFFHGCILAVMVVTNMLGMVGALTMVAFSVVQHDAIRHPLLRSAATRRRKKVAKFLAASWLTWTALGLGPPAAWLPLLWYRDCEASPPRALLKAIDWVENTSAVAQVILYVGNAILCAAIYCRLRLARREFSRFRFEHSLRSERRAFVTIFILLVTLNLFFFPSIIIHLISLNADDVTLLSTRAVIYFMNMLPYVKYATDPIVYGLRMQELIGCCVRSRDRCCGWRNVIGQVKAKGEAGISLYRMTSVSTPSEFRSY